VAGPFYDAETRTWDSLELARTEILEASAVGSSADYEDNIAALISGSNLTPLPHSARQGSVKGIPCEHESKGGEGSVCVIICCEISGLWDLCKDGGNHAR
jgi:hypothetical protein